MKIEDAGMIRWFREVYFCALIVLLLYGLALPVDAAIVRSGDIVSVPETAVVPGDFYALGGDVNISGVIEGDVYVAGGTVTINGMVMGDVVVVGGTVALHGSVADDVRVIGGKVTLADSIGGDAVSFGGVVSVLSTAHIEGDFLFYGGTADVGGEVVGGIHAQADSLVVDAPVGSIDATLARELLLGDAARVSGDISYESPFQFSRSPNAEISGEITRRTFGETESRSFTRLLLVWLMSVFSALVSVLVFKKHLLHIFHTHALKLGVCGFLGLGVFIIVPITVGILLASLIGALVGLFVLLMFLALLLVSFVIGQVYVGLFLSKVATGAYRLDWLWTCVGVLVTHAVLFVPFIGPTLLIALMLVVLGAMSLHIYSSTRGV